MFKLQRCNWEDQRITNTREEIGVVISEREPPFPIQILLPVYWIKHCTSFFCFATVIKIIRTKVTCRLLSEMFFTVIQLWFDNDNRRITKWTSEKCWSWLLLLSKVNGTEWNGDKRRWNPIHSYLNISRPLKMSGHKINERRNERVLISYVERWTTKMLHFLRGSRKNCKKNRSARNGWRVYLSPRFNEQTSFALVNLVHRLLFSATPSKAVHIAFVFITDHTSLVLSNNFFSFATFISCLK